MTLEFAPHLTRTTHMTGSRFPWPPPETGTRKSDDKTIRGSFFEAQTYLNTIPQERDTGRFPRAGAAIPHSCFPY
jgi:hypothetical protein